MSLTVTVARYHLETLEHRERDTEYRVIERVLHACGTLTAIVRGSFRRAEDAALFLRALEREESPRA